jgi:hypothetical protein
MLLNTSKLLLLYILLKGLNCRPLLLLKSAKGIANNIRIALSIAVTPNGGIY